MQLQVDQAGGKGPADGDGREHKVPIIPGIGLEGLLQGMGVSSI